jgi:hypothetical protein
VGGINYNLKVGDTIFVWAGRDRAEPGVSTDNTGTATQKAAYRTKSSLGNWVKVLTGEAKGAREWSLGSTATG